jgi:formate/nitrite transporter FocA (FNT family)
MLILGFTAGAFIGLGGLVTITVCGGIAGTGGIGAANPGLVRVGVDSLLLSAVC